MGAVNQT